MKVRFTPRALAQLSAVLDYIEARSPRGAENVKRQIRTTIDVLVDYPRSGRATNRAGVRRIIVHGYPHVIFYQPTLDAIVIHGVRHTARRPLG